MSGAGSKECSKRVALGVTPMLGDPSYFLSFFLSAGF